MVYIIYVFFLVHRVKEILRAFGAEICAGDLHQAARAITKELGVFSGARIA